MRSTSPLSTAFSPSIRCSSDWRKKAPDTHVILTGRGAPPALIDQADLVTEMSLVKHPFREQGVKAQPGIEF